MSKFRLSLIPVTLGTLAMIGCGPSKQQVAANSAQTALTADGSSWTQVKVSTEVAGYTVFKGPDGQYIAIDVSKYTPGMTKDQLLAAGTVYNGLVHGTKQYQSWEVVGSDSETYSCDPDTDASCDSDGTETVYTDEYGWVNETEEIYTDKGSGLVFEIGDTSSKDLAAVSGAVEKLSNDQVRSALVMSYGLSEDRAQELASLSQSWQNISKSRTMTAKDMVEFQSKVFGADLKTISAAADKASKGDSAQYNSLMQKAAALNNISPEQANSIIQGFVN